MNRRQVLQSFTVTPLAAAARGAATSKMTVADLEIFQVKVNHRGNWILLRLHTSNGLTGIGEASHGSDVKVLTLLRKYFESIKGRSVFDLEWLRAHAENEVKESGITGAIALSGIEQCLWDIHGKALGVPVYDLLGGKLHDRIRNYANINRSTVDRTPAGFAAMAEKAIAAGFDAVKLAPFDNMPRGLTDAGKIEEFAKLGLDC